MKTALLLIIATLFFAATSCMLPGQADIAPDDLLTVEQDNSSIQNYERRTLCSKKISELRNKELKPLLAKLLVKDLELGDGSTYMRLTLTDSETDSVKYTTEIDYGTREKDAQKLIRLIEKECGLE